jgi:hypothetical protein
MQGKEIEKKWLLKYIPFEVIEKGAQFYAETDYLSFENEVRLRKLIKADGTTDYIISFKTPGGMIRNETNLTIPPDVYDELRTYSLAKNVRIYWVYDEFVFTQVNRGSEITPYKQLLYLEREFKTPEEAEKFDLSQYAWICDCVEKDITNDQKYKMKNWTRSKK